MKRFLLTIAIILIGMIGYAQNKTADITRGNTLADFSFTAADTINESETYYVEITNFQDFGAMQDVYLAGSAVTGSGDVVITVYGKKFSASSYSSIGTTTWNSTLALDETITVTTANRYRYFKVEFVSDATDKQVLVTDIKFKNWFTGGDLSTASLTLSGALEVGTTLTVTGESTFNNHINLGAGDDLIGSATSDIAFNTTAFTVAGATGNTSVGGTLGVTGIFTPTSGVALPTESTHIWTVGGSITAVTDGNDAACSDGDRYWTEIMIPYNTTITGGSYLVGSVGGTDSVVMQLYNSAGTEVATSKTTGANHGALVGTTAEFQNLDFVTPYVATAGVYYVGVQFNGTTAKFRTYTIPNSKFVAATAGGTWDTQAGITPGTTFTVNVGPIVLTY